MIYSWMKRIGLDFYEIYHMPYMRWLDNGHNERCRPEIHFIECIHYDLFVDEENWVGFL